MVKSLRSRMLLVLRWIGVLATMMVLFLLVYSSRRCIQWTSRSCRTQVMLISCALDVSRAQSDFDPLATDSPPRPGFYCGEVVWLRPARTIWLPKIQETPRYHLVTIPLWIVLLAIAAPTALLWYRDWRSVQANIAGMRRRLAPKRPVRIRFVTWLGFAGLHIAALIGAGCAETALINFFQVNFVRLPWWYDLVWMAAFWGFPVFAWLWAWLYVRWRNQLYKQFQLGLCRNCGYDLTGNVTGVCPECGVERPSTSRRIMR